jgi:hypothetical protein
VEVRGLEEVRGADGRSAGHSVTSAASVDCSPRQHYDGRGFGSGLHGPSHDHFCSLPHHFCNRHPLDPWDGCKTSGLRGGRDGGGSDRGHGGLRADLIRGDDPGAGCLQRLVSSGSSAWIGTGR